MYKYLYCDLETPKQRQLFRRKDGDIMRQPRLMKHPNGGLLNVDVTMLQLGLSQCRSDAERALMQLEHGVEIDIVAVLTSIVERARSAVHEISEYEMGDEVGVLSKVDK